MPPKKSGGAYGPDPDKKKKSKKKEEKKPMTEHRLVLGDSKKEKKLASKLTKKSIIPFKSKKGQKKPETVTKVLLSEAKREIGKVGGKKELQEVLKKGARDVEVVGVYTDMLKGKVKGDPVKEKKLASKLTKKSIIPFKSKKGQKKPETVTKVLLSEAKREIGKVGGKKELQEVLKKGARDVEVVGVYTDMLKGKVKGDPVKELDRRSIVAASKHVEDKSRAAAEKKAREEAKEKAAEAAKRKALTKELDIERKVKEAKSIRHGGRARSTTVKSRNPPPKKSIVVTKGGKNVGS